MRTSTVLVVDDHIDSRTICEIILARHGFAILSAADGASAVELARAERPDAILLDVALPRMDGWAVVAELKRDSSTAKIPIVMYTAHSLDAYRIRATALGCAAFLVKPCSPQQILEAVRAALADLPTSGTPMPEPA